METRRLGTGGPLVSRLGLGCMAMSGTYGPADDDDMASIERAVPAGAAAGERYGAAQMAALDSERGR